MSTRVGNDHVSVPQNPLVEFQKLVGLGGWKGSRLCGGMCVLTVSSFKMTAHLPFHHLPW